MRGPKSFDGSPDVYGGKLTGATDTDHFYFFCPKCGGTHILQISDFKILRDGPVKYVPEVRQGAKRDFAIGLELRCHNCGLHDFVRISNADIQGGELGKAFGF